MLLEDEKRIGLCRDLQSFSDFDFDSEMGSHFQGFTRKGIWSDLHCKEMILSAVLRIAYRGQEQKQDSIRKLEPREKQLAFSFPLHFTWLFSGYQCHIVQITTSLGAHISYKKRKLVQRDFHFPSNSGNMWTINLHMYRKSNFPQYSIKYWWF